MRYSYIDRMKHDKYISVCQCLLDSDILYDFCQLLVCITICKVCIREKKQLTPETQRIWVWKLMLVLVSSTIWWNLIVVLLFSDIDLNFIGHGITCAY